MPLIRYKVTLNQQERQSLQEIATRGKHSSQKMLNALILLGCDEGPFQDRKLTAHELTGVLPVSMRKVDRVKRRFVEQGLEAALVKPKANRQYVKKADGDFEAHLIALKRHEATPAGHCVYWPTRWWS
jgi:hypothetical protein